MPAGLNRVGGCRCLPLLMLAAFLQLASLCGGEGELQGEELFQSLPPKSRHEKRLLHGCKELAPRLPPQQPQRILIVLKGISYDSRYKGAMYNYTKTYKKFFRDIVEPWRAEGHSVDVGISTFKSSKLQHIKQVYDPVFLETASKPYRAAGRTKVDSLLEALEAAESHGGADKWDFVVVTRFDIRMKMPMTDLSVDFNKINFPWRQRMIHSPYMSSWLRIPRVADSFQMLPAHLLPKAIEASKLMLEDAHKNPDLSRWNDCHNLLYNMRKLGVSIEEDVHFMMTDFCKTKRNHNNPIYSQLDEPVS